VKHGIIVVLGLLTACSNEPVDPKLTRDEAWYLANRDQILPDMKECEKKYNPFGEDFPQYCREAHAAWKTNSVGR
jgi:hypothetical protein